MARLQDYPTVIPTDSDNLLVVQATGQGLATVGSTLGTKMDKANPTGTGSLSLNRKANTTTGAYSTAEGYNCEASGSGSHAEGDGTIANHNSQHVFGTYNLADTSSADPTAKGNYVEVVGNGANTNSRSNARTLDWSGNEVLAGGLKINGTENVLPGVLSGTVVRLTSWSNNTTANIGISTNTGKQFVITINSNGAISGIVINPS